jgi:hypothetical protein
MRSWLAGQVAQVPDDISACEFECRTASCPASRWQVCARRLGQARALRHGGMPKLVMRA